MAGSFSSLLPTRPPNRSRHRRALILLLLASIIVVHHVAIDNTPSMYSNTDADEESVSFFKRTKLSAIAFLRMAIFPLLRRPIRCVPRSTKVANVTIDMASIYHRATGSWTEELRDMYQLSERNKAEYVGRNKHFMNSLHNGSRWAIENIGRLPRIKNYQWFKPMFVRELIQNMTAAGNGTAPDWIIYLDHDIVILNHDFDLRKLISWSGGDAHENIAMIISTDANDINTGAFIIRANDFGLRIMNAWVEGARASGMGDQGYFCTIFDDDGYLKRIPNAEGGETNKSLVPRMKLVRPCALNSGGGIESRPVGRWPYFEGVYCHGDFAVHFFGRPDKLAQMKDADGGSLGFFSR